MPAFQQFRFGISHSPEGRSAGGGAGEMLWRDEPSFLGGALDRAAELRSDAAAQELLLQDATSRILLFWRGRPLVSGASSALVMVKPGDAVLLQGAVPLFMGRGPEGQAFFAVELTAWVPEDLPADQPLPDEVAHPGLPVGAVFAELRSVMTGLTALEAELAATARSLFAWHASHRFCSQCGQPSEPVQAGWVRRCPHCGAQHFPRTDPVVIMLVTRGNKALLGRSPGWAEGMYSCLAGFMEPGETLAAAVRREVREETAVEVGPVRYLSSQPWPYPSSLMLGCHGEALSDEIRLDPAEIEDAFWISREDLAEVFAGRHPVVRPPRQGAIARQLLRLWLADALDCVD